MTAGWARTAGLTRTAGWVPGCAHCSVDSAITVADDHVFKSQKKKKKKLP